MANEIYALFDTTEGKFKVRLFADKAPLTVANFVSLAEGTKTGKPFYNGTVFHRVIPNFMIQGEIRKAPAGAARLPLRRRVPPRPEAFRPGNPLDGQFRPEHQRQPVLRHRGAHAVARQKAQRLRRGDRRLRGGAQNLRSSPRRAGPAAQGSEHQLDRHRAHHLGTRKP